MIICLKLRRQSFTLFSENPIEEGMKKAQLRKPIKYKERNPDQNRQKILRILLCLLLLSAAGFFMASLDLILRPQKAEPVSAYSPQAEVLVNKHLFFTSQSQHLREKKMDIENSYLAPELGDSIWPKIAAKKDQGVDHSPDRNENTAFDDLNRYHKDLHYTNPDQIIQGQIVDEELSAKDQLEYRQEYARQFVENARRNGYIIKLNEDLVVIKVSPMGGASH